MVHHPPDPARFEFTQPVPDLGETIRAALTSGGGLHRCAERLGHPFEERPEQVVMAGQVLSALMGRHHLAVEAGTGVGKSLAYLLPALTLLRHTSVRGVISTHTIHLQEQLLRKDVPTALEALGLPGDFPVVLGKGRGNYLCLRRLHKGIESGGEMIPDLESAMFDELRRIEVWSRDHTHEGSRQVLPFKPSPQAWNGVCAEQGNCLHARCPFYEPCFYQKARRRLHGARLLIVNHHLLFAELGVRSRGGSFLPPYDFAILDEAHALEAVAGEHLGARISVPGVRRILHRLYHPDKDRGLLKLLGDSAGMAAARDVEERLLFAGLELDEWFDREVQGGEQSALRFRSAGCLSESWMTSWATLRRLLVRNVEELKDDGQRQEMESLLARMNGAEEAWRSIRELQPGDWVHWAERERPRWPLGLHGAPVELGGLLEQVLFEEVKPVVMCSATLSPDPELDYFCRRMGVAGAARCKLTSPFDYARQAALWISPDISDPVDDPRGFERDVVALLVHFGGVKRRGQALVLFTAYGMLRRVAHGIREPLAARGVEVLEQGGALTRSQLVDRFRRSEGAVLLGTDSFWTGVDIPGPALSTVIVVRLPFAVPDHPLTEARLERERMRSHNPFRSYTLPEAMIKFRQGMGRLIRTKTDTGDMVVLDPRIVTRWYGRQFIESLPGVPVRRFRRGVDPGARAE